ncbi:MAG: hypothetical protein A2481_02490 [Candidatus Yonathbacteria bacterium RIFOXYC2_FULL_47_9]|nr:MAG: hypothetical protein A2481_02490 [Candidatus Yonathbacteria bacterium RIFOXYC2_FULL_47_9]HAT68567.1 hypothetical protein [Candidatus Yonathbacteria bacterium]
MKSGTLLLTSIGLSSPNVLSRFLEIVGDTKNKQVAIITTAAEGKEVNKYSQLAHKQFVDLGFSGVDFVDLEADPTKDLSPYGVIYVCGGNTFKLLKFALTANFKNSVESLLKMGGVYIGVSAGSIIVGPSVKIADEVQPDPNEVGISDFSGLGIIKEIVLPHYSPEIEEQVKIFENKHNVIIDRIDNSQAILVQEGYKTIIE